MKITKRLICALCLTFAVPVYAEETHINGIEQGGGSASVSDTQYGGEWDGDTATGASRNAIYDKIETLSIVTRGQAWDILEEYDTGDVVTFDGSVWISLQNNNIGNDVSEGVYWTEASVSLLAPGPIGDTTPNTGKFTYLECDSLTITPPPAGSTGEFAMHEDPNSTGTDMVGFKAPVDVNLGGSQAGDLLLVLPGDDGMNGQALVTDGSQTLRWETVLPVATPATATTPCTSGQWSYDTSYYYICTATDTWARVGVATW